MDIIKEAEIWFIDNGILPSSVNYNLYTQKQALRNLQATAILGVGKSRQGERIGFAIEVVAGKGIVAGGILEPDGVATWGKRGLARSLATNKPLIDVMQDIASEHRIALEDYEYTSKEQRISSLKSTQKQPSEYQESSKSIEAKRTLSEIKATKSLNQKKAVHKPVFDDENEEDDKPQDFEGFLEALGGVIAIHAGFLMTVSKFGSDSAFGTILVTIWMIFLGAFVIWYLVRTAKTAYIMHQYSTTQGVIGAICWLLGVLPIAAAFFYFSYDLEETDEYYIKGMFAVTGTFLLMIILAQMIS